MLHGIRVAFFDRIYQAAKMDVANSAKHCVSNTFLHESEAALRAHSQASWRDPSETIKASSIVRDCPIDLILLDGRPDTPQTRQRMRWRVDAMQQLDNRCCSGQCMPEFCHHNGFDLI